MSVPDRFTEDKPAAVDSLGIRCQGTVRSLIFGAKLPPPPRGHPQTPHSTPDPTATPISAPQR
jgi:hypothetical protein